MKEDEIELTLEQLYEHRTKLNERMKAIDKAIKDYTDGLHGLNTGTGNTKPDVQHCFVDGEKDCQEIINILKLTGRPLRMSEIKNYLDNNLGIQFQQTGMVLKKLKDKNILASLKLNNTKKLSYWVMSEWIDWETHELKRKYKKFGITKSFSIKTIEIF